MYEVNVKAKVAVFVELAFRNHVGMCPNAYAPVHVYAYMLIVELTFRNYVGAVRLD